MSKSTGLTFAAEVRACLQHTLITDAGKQRQQPQEEEGNRGQGFVMPFLGHLRCLQEGDGHGSRSCNPCYCSTQADNPADREPWWPPGARPSSSRRVGAHRGRVTWPGSPLAGGQPSPCLLLTSPAVFPGEKLYPPRPQQARRWAKGVINLFCSLTE